MNETFQQPGRWHDVILTPAQRQPTEPLSHVMSFTLRGLQAGSVYEAIVQAKNRYGWNEVSTLSSANSNPLLTAALAAAEAASACK